MTATMTQNLNPPKCVSWLRSYDGLDELQSCRAKAMCWLRQRNQWLGEVQEGSLTDRWVLTGEYPENLCDVAIGEAHDLAQLLALERSEAREQGRQAVMEEMHQYP